MVQIFFPPPRNIMNSPRVNTTRKEIKTARKKVRNTTNRLFNCSIHDVKPPAAPCTVHGRRRPQNKFLLTPPQPKFVEKFSSLKQKVENGRYIESPCPICKDKLGSENICILSCGHLVHKTCLNSFNRFVNEKTPRCPVCHALYKIVDIRIDIKTLNKCATMIQRNFRGFLARQKIEEFAPRGSIMHRKWVLKQAQSTSMKLSDVIERQNDNVDIMLNSIDEELEWARSIMKAVDARGMKLDWKEVRRRARERKGRCAVCLREIEEDKAVVTSCGHIFHEDCLESWIQYCSKDQKQTTCPECRSYFQVRPLIENRILEMDIF